LLAIVLLISVGLGAAEANAAGSGPDDAVTPTGDWEQLGPGESRWYAFQYLGDGSQIQITLQIEPDTSAGFGVWTPDLIRRWGLGEYVEPVGRGSDDPYTDNTLVWSGSSMAPGTYYAVVEHAGNHPGTSYYLLNVSGTGVSLSEPTPASEPASTQAGDRTQVNPPTDLSGKLVFQTTYGGTFYTISVNGTGLQPVTNGIDPAWSPDGEQIAFTRWDDPRGVWVVSAAGGEQQVFAWNDARWPSWSLDGGQIVFTRQYGGRTEEVERCFRGRCRTLPADPHWKLGVVDSDGGAFAEPVSSDTSLAPDWSPDGQLFVYDDVHGLTVQTVDGEISYTLTDQARDTLPVWSPDGEQVAFVRSQHDHWEVYLVDADGSDLIRLTNTPTRPEGAPSMGGVPGNSVSPAWSPDGSYIAFLTDRSGQWEIWVMDADGSNPRSLFDTQLDGLTLEYTFVAERAIDWTQ
jgi:Tol biopolymer transport system component